MIPGFFNIPTHRRIRLKKASALIAYGFDFPRLIQETFIRKPTCRLR